MPWLALLRLLSESQARESLCHIQVHICIAASEVLGAFCQTDYMCDIARMRESRIYAHRIRAYVGARGVNGANVLKCEFLIRIMFE